MTGPVNPAKGFTYPLPTQNEDGSPLAPADIAKFQIGLGQTSGAYTLIKDDVTVEAGSEVTPMSLLGTLAFGQWYAAVRTVSQAGKTSKWSPEVAFVLEAPVPSAPGNFTIS